MDKQDKSINCIRISVTLTQGILLIIDIALVFWRSIYELNRIYVVNIAMDIIGMLVAMILFLGLLSDIKHEESEQMYMAQLVVFCFFGQFLDVQAWLFDGLPDFRIMVIISNVLYYMVSPILTFLFLRYVMYYLRLDTNVFVKKVDRIFMIGLFLALLIRFISIWGGYYFTVDVDGVYHRGGLSPLSMIFTMLCMLFTIFLLVKERKSLKRREKIIFAVYVSIPILLMIVSSAVYGLSVIMPVSTAMVLLMYCVLNVNRGREQAMKDYDLNVASDIQESLLPHTFPFLPDRIEFDLFAVMNPAKEVGGDFYDFFLVDEEHLALVIADVSGKGVPAALFMMRSKSLIKSRTKFGGTPAEILFDVNNDLCENNPNEMFVTLWLGILDLATGEMVCASAGHEYPYVMDENGVFSEYEDPRGLVLGAMDGLPYAQYTLTIPKGGGIYVFTDGVRDARDDKGEAYEKDRLTEALNSIGNKTTQEIIDGVMTSIRGFIGKVEQFDDITMLCMKYFGK